MVGLPGRLSPATVAAVTAPDQRVFLSVASVWEIAIKRSAGRLTFPLPQLAAITATLGLEILPILPAHAMLAADLPRHHADPFDRMLIAQALAESLILVTEDEVIPRYKVPILGQDTALD